MERMRQEKGIYFSSSTIAYEFGAKVHVGNLIGKYNKKIFNKIMLKINNNNNNFYYNDNKIII